MVQLNQNFINSIAKDIPANLSMDDFIDYCGKPLRPSIRVNTLKISSADLIAHLTPKGWQFEAIPWCQDGYWITVDPSIQIGNTIEHIQGLFYIQEASSMLPPTALFPHKVSQPLTLLDMASAPGSKTTQLAAMMDNDGILVANEYSASRVKVLHANILRMGVSNCALTHFDARVFGEYQYETFDHILLDAPCSGEGTVRKDPDALKHWDESEIDAIAATQKDLIKSAFLALKPGGSLVYSTCTLNRKENQAIMAHIQQCYPGAVRFDSLAELFTGADKACTDEGFLHVWPQIFDSEGFFVAKLTKTASVVRDQPQPKAQKVFPFTPASRKQTAELEEYLQQTFGINFQDNNLMVRDDEFWLFPRQMEPLIGKMRYQRIGIKLADKIKKGFKPRHEALIALTPKTHMLALDEDQALQYLMGRDITLAEKTKPQGEKVVSYLGAPLGLAKHLGNKLKNSLPRELVKDKVIKSA
ncbi:16S rRNA (cytosine(1407)-C(5))-methyltransferase RsmF [Shewanella waksmanii]|uniref:16S rRNA (cytosine(1407)-C(5))-methyltransferase RsmF n=1 Tax=Shewanella waksmanii TaxID=213783 RepID=UPI00048A8D84|nr:16S rRNA (cytosine(1407)-C(5))-methyltransferase RsmF [Shewanella waksmanii]